MFYTKGFLQEVKGTAKKLNGRRARFCSEGVVVVWV